MMGMHLTTTSWAREGDSWINVEAIVKLHKLNPLLILFHLLTVTNYLVQHSTIQATIAISAPETMCTCTKRDAADFVHSFVPSLRRTLLTLG